MLWERELREQEFQRREQAGEMVFSEHLSERTGPRTAAALGLLLNGGSDAFAQSVDMIMYSELGRRCGEFWYELVDELENADTDEFLSLAGACYLALKLARTGNETKFEAKLNKIFRQERDGYEMVSGRIIQRESEELHTAVVAPVVRLLNGRPGWEAVEVSYQKALSEGDPPQAIVAAGTALQDALRACGAKGDAHADLIKDARRRDLLTGWDERMLDAVKLLVDWSAADRAKKGDAHTATTASPEDAWLAIHVVGALIFRLAGGTPRAGS